MTSKTFSVVGGGAVGKAVEAYYKNVKVYDKYHARDPIEEAAAADYIFVAVPTPYNNGPDLTEMNDAIANIVARLKAPEKQVIIIKSTILPGTTDDYQTKYPDANFIFNPEFLTESTKEEDFAKPDKQLVGYTEKARHLAEGTMAVLPPAPYMKILPAKVCEMAKYAINAFYAFKVIFSNSIFDLCEKLKIDYDTVREGHVADSRIVDSHFDVFHGGYRGYGGKCLPKDVETLAWLAEQKDIDLGFIKKIIEINKSLRGEKMP